MPFRFEKVFRGTRSHRQGPDGASDLLCERIHKTRFSRINLSDQNDPHRRGWLDSVGHVALLRGADLRVREYQSAGVEFYGGVADLEYQQSRYVGPQSIGKHLGGLFHENAACLLADRLQRHERASDDAPKTEAHAPTGPCHRAIALILAARP